MKNMGATLSQMQVYDLLWEVDDDLDGRLSLNDFLLAYARCEVQN